MTIPILMVSLCVVLAVVGICAAASYSRLRDFSSCASPQAEPRSTSRHFRGNASVRRSSTVLETIAAAERANTSADLERADLHANSRVQVRTWSDLQRFHRDLAFRIEAIRRACEGRSSARLDRVTIDVRADYDAAGRVELSSRA